MSIESLRALEQVRLRLQSLANSLGKLQHDLSTNDPLPSWYGPAPHYFQTS
jgi:mediator of RNA polymerase II transcription subunit 8